jgi:hypothetical protein
MKSHKIRPAPQHTTWHDTHHMFQVDEISLDHKDWDRCLYVYSTQNINGCKLVIQAAHYHPVLISQHCNFLLVKFIYFTIVIF